MADPHDATAHTPTTHTHTHAATTGQGVNDHHAEDHDHDGTPTQTLLASRTHGSPSADTHHSQAHGAAEHTGIGAALSVIATSDTSESLGVGFVDATGLSFSIAANKTYHFDFFIRWESAATTTGINLAMNGPASPTAVAFVAFSAFNLTTYSPRPMTAYETSTSGTGASATGTALIAEIRGIIVNGSNAGTLQVRFQTEVIASAVTIKAGSGGRLWLMN